MIKKLIKMIMEATIVMVSWHHSTINIENNSKSGNKTNNKVIKKSVNMKIAVLLLIIIIKRLLITEITIMKIREKK